MSKFGIGRMIDKLTEAIEDDENSETRQVSSPLELSRMKRLASGKKTQSQVSLYYEEGDIAPKKDPYLDFSGFRVPKNLNNPWAVSRFLIQKKGKLSMKEIRSSTKNSTKLTAQAKVNTKFY